MARSICIGIDFRNNVFNYTIGIGIIALLFQESFRIDFNNIIYVYYYSLLVVETYF